MIEYLKQLLKNSDGFHVRVVTRYGPAVDAGLLHVDSTGLVFKPVGQFHERLVPWHAVLRVEVFEE